MAAFVWLLPVSQPAAERAGQTTRFAGSIEKLDPDLRQRMTGSSWHRGCPVSLSRLRLLRVRYWGFNRQIRRGHLVVHADSARGMYRVMKKLFDRRFVIKRMRLVDAYGADDHRSMDADNTSAFNCREVSGKPGVWSQHAYGRAIDLNPRENPYVTSGGFVSPPAGRPFARRKPHRKGMVSARGRVVKIFAGEGWRCGGSWVGTKDYQHFFRSPAS